MSEYEVSAVLEAVDTIADLKLRARALATVLLARGAGTTSLDLRYVTGRDIVDIPDAGLWVTIGRPRSERIVPVLLAYASQLRRLARNVGGRSLVGQRRGAVPCARADVIQVMDAVQFHADRLVPGIVVSVERLRRTWLLGRMRDPVSVHDFLRMTGDPSWATIRELVPFCQTSDIAPALTARCTGAVSDEALYDLAAWGLF
jgi:hypothetical protein